MFRVYVDSDLIDFIPQFIVNRASDVSRMLLALNDNDFTKLRFINHDIRGIAIPYGFIGLDALSQRLSLEIESKDLIAINKTLLDMADYMQNVSYSAILAS